MKNKKLVIIIIILIVILMGTIYLCYFSDNEESILSNVISSENIEVRTESTELNIQYSEEELNGDYSQYDTKIILNDAEIEIEGSGVLKKNNTLTISTGGKYYITGSISDGNIVIDADKDEEVQLILDNVSITSKNTSPINGIKAGKITITLVDGSENAITDSNNYTEFTDDDKTEPDATIFSKTDLIINGNGKLILNSNYKDGIATKDGLKIINANIEINSEDDGIRGKDYVVIKNGNINIDSKGDGIKSTNDEDLSLGYVVLQGGNIKITSEADGIQSQTILNISDKSNINISSSGKSLKAGEEITIEDVNIEINSTDDSIHSNGIIIINGGNYNLYSEDDGIHADTNIVINSGNINITKSYEGIESSYIEINGGTILIKASDDGINISGGNDQSAMGGRIGQNSFTSVKDTNRKLVINNGNITVNADGDGLDSNGSIYLNGGNVLVKGTTSNGNGALDYDTEFVVTGGSLIAYGSTGMWQNPSTNSTQYSLTFSISGKQGDEIILKDSFGNNIANTILEKTSSGIVISNSNIINGETYSLYLNGTNVGSLTANNIINSNLSSNGMDEGMMQKQGGNRQFKGEI